MRFPIVVLDTNVLVSAVAYPHSLPARILDAWGAGLFQVALSEYILDELIRVLPRFKCVSLSPDEILRLAEGMRGKAYVVTPAPVSEPGVRDPKDEPILGTLIAAQADCLITGDKDLLALAGSYPILSPSAFWQTLTQ